MKPERALTADLLKAAYPDAQSADVVCRLMDGTETDRWPVVFVPSLGLAALFRTDPAGIVWYTARSLKDATSHPGRRSREPRRPVGAKWKAGVA